MPYERMTFKVEAARLLPFPFMNFSGRPDKFNVEGGKRTFCVALDVKTAEAMSKDGWNVKFPDPRGDDEEDVRDPYIQVEVKYKVRPPKITMITSASSTILTEDLVGILDGMDFANVDLIANASTWEVGGKTGIKAYLKTMYVTIDEDELDLKYSAMEGR